MYIKKLKDRILWSIPDKPALVQILANGCNVGMIADTGRNSKAIRPILYTLLKQIQNRPSNIDLIEVYFDRHQVLRLTSLKQTVVNELKLFYQYYSNYLNVSIYTPVKLYNIKTLIKINGG